MTHETGLGRAGAEGDGRLTAREREVLALVSAGLREEEMAERLGIAESTVATLLRSSMAKLDAHTRLEAAAIWARSK